MKYKLLCVILLIAAFAAAFCFAVGAEESDPPPVVAESDRYCAVRGDADGDRDVTAADARLVLRAVLGMEKFTAAQRDNCDLYEDRQLTAADARSVLRVAVSLDPRPEHKEKASVVTQEATCYEPGITAHICAFCGEYYGFGLIPQKQHTAVGWETVREATCSKAGVKAQYCIYCGECIAQSTIPAKPHIYGDMRFRSETPDCTHAQEVYKVCLVCGHEQNWIRPGSAHTYEWVTVLSPTCTEQGTQEEVCRVCGIKSGNTKVVPTLGGHIASGWTVIKYPTYSEEGLQRKVCTRCGEILEEEVIPKKQ